MRSPSVSSNRRRKNSARPKYQESEQEQHDVEIAFRDAAEELEKVLQAADDEAGEIPKAFVVKGADDLTEDDVKGFVSDRVSSYKQIRAVEFVDEIPKSASWKILRRVLVDREKAGASQTS